MDQEEISIRITDKVFVGSFMGRSGNGPLRKYISISDDKEPGLGEWLTITEARRLIKALQKLVDH